MRAAFNTFNFEARLTEMRRVGEELDARLNEFRAQARRFGVNDASSVQDQVVRLAESMSSLDVRFAGHEQKLCELEDHVGESMIAVHDRLTSQWDNTSAELKKLTDRLENTESEVALLSDEDFGQATATESLQKASDSLRVECQEFVLQQLEPSTARLTALENHSQQLEEHFSQQLDFLEALRTSELVRATQGDAHKDWKKQAQDDMRWPSPETNVCLTCPFLSSLAIPLPPFSRFCAPLPSL